MENVLKDYFGFSSLRPYQQDVIDKVLEGRDCLVVMATGAGKSLCYQLPPLISRKTCIVISPLLSLMQDQVMSLNQKGVKSDYLASTQMNLMVTSKAQAGYYHVLYMTPEKAMSLTKIFWSNMVRSGICLLAVDEAHCISEWGHDFRVEYKRLNLLRQHLPGVPYVALTATATQRVRSDIKESLALRNPYVYIGSFDRPNLFYGVKLVSGPGRTTSFIHDVIDDISTRVMNLESTIIYCATVRDTEQVHEALTSNGISTAIYHGQMDSPSRELSHKSFVTDEVFVMVATIAFGMGIDKPNVRCVIHFGCPKSLESYYQESGRCGRDGLPSVCWLYYQRSDFTRGEFYCAEIKSDAQKEAIMNSFIAGQKYCILGTCRRKHLLNYFGEETTATCGNCDNCTSMPAKQKDLTEESILLLSCIKECGGHWGFNLPINVLRGSNAKRVIQNSYEKLYLHGLGKEHTSQWWKALGNILIDHGFLYEKVHSTYRLISISEKGQQFLDGIRTGVSPLVFTLSPDMVDDEEEESIVDYGITLDDEEPHDQSSLSNEEMQVYQMLVEVRKKIADDNDAAPYAICGDQVLRSLSSFRPSNKENLALVDGVNLNFINCFSVIILHSIKEISQDLNLALDNNDIYDTDDNLDHFITSDNEGEMSHEEIKQSVLNLLSSTPGVPLGYIVVNCTSTDEEAVAAAVDDLECEFEIYKKNGLFFPM